MLETDPTERSFWFLNERTTLPDCIGLGGKGEEKEKEKEKKEEKKGGRRRKEKKEPAEEAKMPKGSDTINTSNSLANTS